MQDINDFWHLAIKGLPKDFAPIISEWVDNNPEEVDWRRKEWEEEGSEDKATINGDEADMGEGPLDNANHP